MSEPTTHFCALRTSFTQEGYPFASRLFRIIMSTAYKSTIDPSPLNPGTKATKDDDSVKDWTNAQKFVCLSGTFAAISGLLVIFSYQTALLILPGLVEAAASSSEEEGEAPLPAAEPTMVMKLLLGSSLIGWAVGKFNAAFSNSAKQYCRLNVLPFTGVVMHCYVAQSWDLPLWSVFYMLYIYFGFVE